MTPNFIKIAAVATALVLAGCGSDVTNSNSRNTTSNHNTARTAPSPSPTIDRTNSNISREEYEKNRSEYERDKGSSTIGQGVDDSWIWFKTRAALMTTSDLRDSTINVDVVNDMITLEGTVATAAQKAKAEQVAKGIEGQKGVKNELKVAPNDSVTNMSSAPTRPNSNTRK